VTKGARWRRYKCAAEELPMMRRNVRAGVVLSLTVAASTAGCGGEKPAGGFGGDVDDVGDVAIALSQAPSDAACLRVTSTGSRTVSRLFALTPGATPVLVMDRLPIGVNQLDAQAFAVACAGVAAPTTASPTWVAEAPTFIHIDPGALAQASLTMIRNGRASVGIDFETAPWISSSRTPVELAVFGDAPYGAAQIADFPKFIADINAAAPAVREPVALAGGT
jgi:hypothetical protein